MGVRPLGVRSAIAGVLFLILAFVFVVVVSTKKKFFFFFFSWVEGAPKFSK